MCSRWRITSEPFLVCSGDGQVDSKNRQESPCTMKFADDIVICGESREQVERGGGIHWRKKQ